ncbi:neprosin family prolyl endopeptidase [Actinoplanes bogorensis]|uniref:Neprosin family prolyl endopeptidase n=1 Tax=Paractinoplanes bogorensis TaxID=1610840 RepID=A0ABS5YVW1_9ACTN|nr:neprosin family prolyl endopeptidase [Actinoplanes bogorensis]
MIGAIGVVSTVNAGADQIASPPEASSAPAAADAPDSSDPDIPIADEDLDATPPPKLPWGDAPKKIRAGRDGASSKSLKDQGLSAALAEPDSSLVPEAVEAPKGRSIKGGVMKSEETDEVPPPPQPLGLKAETKVNYLYNVGSTAADSAGVYANITIGKPELDKTDYHTLAELALQSADGQQTVEVGWTVDRLVNGDDDPHLFVFHWVNGKPTCYNKCGWVQADGEINPGATLSYGVTKKFGIQYYDKGWWIAYDTSWIGYFPESNWNDQGVKFNRSGYVQVFGEVATISDNPCTDMGNGTDAVKDAAARVSSVSFIDGPTTDKIDMYIRSTNSKIYPVSPISLRSFRYGGPGSGFC